MLWIVRLCLLAALRSRLTSIRCAGKTFGVPIIKHQAIATLLSEMAIATEASRMLTWKSAWIKDTGGRNTFYASMAKAMASQSAVDNAAKAVQIYGGAGYNTGAPVEKLLRDSFIFKIYEGALFLLVSLILLSVD